jgi:hypothetical protein
MALNDKLSRFSNLQSKQPSSQKVLVKSATPAASNEISEMKTNMDQLKREMSELKVKYSALLPSGRHDDNKGVVPLSAGHGGEQTVPDAPRREVFYLSTPNEDGSFNEKSAYTSYREGASIYKFTKTSSREAVFEIDESEMSANLALQYPDKNIDPVCEAQNAFDPKASRIVTVQGGKAELEGDRWKVKKKAVIKYA